MISVIYLTKKAEEIFKQKFKRLDDVSEGNHKGALVVALKEDTSAETSNDIKKEYSIYELCFDKALANKNDVQNKRVFWEGISGTNDFIKSIYIKLKQFKLRMLCQELLRGKVDIVIFSKVEHDEYDDKKTIDSNWPCAEVCEEQKNFFINKINSLKSSNGELSEIVEKMNLSKNK